MALEILTIREFNGRKYACYFEEGQKDLWDFCMKVTQIGELLGYEYPSASIGELCTENLSHLIKFVKLAEQEGYFSPVFSFRGLLEICALSKQPNAVAVSEWLCEIAEDIKRITALALPSEYKRLSDEVDELRQIIQIIA